MGRRWQLVRHDSRVTMTAGMRRYDAESGHDFLSTRTSIRHEQRTGSHYSVQDSRVLV